MDEEIKKKLKELEDRIDDLDSLVEQIGDGLEAHRHSQRDGQATTNY